MNKKAIVLFSGGLDSMLAAKMMIEEGIEIIAINFSAKLCMCGCKASGESAAQRAARTLGISLKTIDITDDFVKIVKNPNHGYGANVNPCIDCKIYMLKRAKDLMKEYGASFLVTGEVLGERPMSQRMDALHIIEKRSGVKDILLRPLTAKNLEPTLPEREGVVDRSKLLGISGRSRKPQMELAKKFGIDKYPNPAGGCLLTDPIFAKRVKDAINHNEFNSDNLALLSIGRHFRLSDGARLVVGRDEEENSILESIAMPSDIIFRLKDHEGPIAILRGEESNSFIEIAAKITAYHTKFREENLLKVIYYDCKSGRQNATSIKPAGLEDIEVLRI